MSKKQGPWAIDKENRMLQASEDLETAARAGDEEKIKDALGRGGNPNHMGRFGHPPLWLCADAGHAHCMEALVNAGARLNSGGHGSVTPLAAAASGGHIESMKELFRLGASVEGQARTMSTPLIWLAQSAPDNLMAAQLLIAHGANHLCRDEFGSSVLDYLARSQRIGSGGGEALAMLIMGMGADPREAPPGKKSPLDEARRMGEGSSMFQALQAFAQALSDREALESLPVGVDGSPGPAKASAPRL